ncbi:GTP-binding protein Rheb isoform X2 [Passer montanus]|uniref:GTP-binding protein Rheb isoform X2 n=1 Tax=Passer montanus TaxID=9160 RepID=UPI00195F552B|nr:GTP-binding protein Rheb isoform X2 [Passer montanus]
MAAPQSCGPAAALPLIGSFAPALPGRSPGKRDRGSCREGSCPAGFAVLGAGSIQRSVWGEPGEGRRSWGRVWSACAVRGGRGSAARRSGGSGGPHGSPQVPDRRARPGASRALGNQHEDTAFSCARGGKSSLTIQFVEGQFVDSYDPTIENTFTKLITVNGQEYHLQLVDTAGQDEYSIFPQTYSIDINGYILVYSVTSIKRIPIMLVGNKKDLHMERVISYEEGKALAESWNAAFLESSAKENQTAVDVFKRIILEAEKIDGAASQGKSSCSVM